MKTCLKSLLVKDRMEMWIARWDTNSNRGVFNTTQGMGGAGYAATTAYYFFIHLIRQTPVGMLLVFPGIYQ